MDFGIVFDGNGFNMHMAVQWKLLVAASKALLATITVLAALHPMFTQLSAMLGW